MRSLLKPLTLFHRILCYPMKTYLTLSILTILLVASSCKKEETRNLMHSRISYSASCPSCVVTMRDSTGKMFEINLSGSLPSNYRKPFYVPQGFNAYIKAVPEKNVSGDVRVSVIEFHDDTSTARAWGIGGLNTPSEASYLVP